MEMRLTAALAVAHALVLVAGAPTVQATAMLLLLVPPLLLLQQLLLALVLLLGAPARTCR